MLYTSSSTFKKNPKKPVFIHSLQAKKAFRSFREPLDASDYIIKRKGKAQNLNYGCCGNMINPYDLYVNLISKLDLKGVTVIQSNNLASLGESPTEIDPNVVPFLDYIVDPSGALFGNTPCGINNFVELMVYDAPK
jgi:hypothetical protein